MRTDYLQVDAWTVLQRLLTAPNALVVEVMLVTGLRVSDVLSLRTEQLKNRFTVKESKTHKSKRIYLNNDLLQRLRNQSGEVFVFEHAKTIYKHRTRQAVWHDVKRASKAMRVDCVVGTHSARKSYAVDIFRRTKDLVRVQSALGHDQLATTIIYLLSEFDNKKNAP